MRGRVIVALTMLTVVAAGPFVTAVEQSYAVATLMEVEKKQRDHVLFYLYNTPIMREDPYFQVTVRLGDTVVVGEYTPRYEGEPLPESWKGDEAIQVRIEPHYIFLKKPGGGEMKFLIADRYKLKSSSKTP